MAKSLLDRLSAEEFALIKQSVYYDPTSPSGLRWRQSFFSGNNKKHKEHDPAGAKTNKAFVLCINCNFYPAAAIVLILNDIWPEEGKNVASLIDQSGSSGDVANLRWAKHGDSHKQNGELRRAALVRSVLGHDGPVLGDRLRLNAPCRKGHLWNGHQLGLYRKGGSSWKCDECEKQRKASPENKAARQEWYRQNLEDQRREGRERMAKLRQDPEYAEIHRERSRKSNAKNRALNGRVSRTGLLVPPHLLGHGIRSADLQPFVAAGLDLNQLDPAMVAESRDQWRQMRQAIQGRASSPSVPRLVMDEQKRYWGENPEAKKRHDGQWDKYRYAWRYKCDPLFRRHECQRNSEKKARNRGNHTVKLCRKDLNARYAEFGNQCAFCGSANRLIVEHFIPRSKGGPHAIGNILPACHSCNSSKFNHDPEVWYRSQPFFTKTRWRKILRVLDKRKGSVAQLPLL